jgi:hypothetical protein
MVLGSITSGRVVAPLKTLVYGPPGVGKTTFAAGAPGAVFFPIEEGTNAVDTARFPAPESFQDVLDGITELERGEHKFKTAIFDTLDALEALIWAKVCADAKKASIEDVGGGWGKGYVAALGELRLFLSRLERLRNTRGMNIVLVAHAQVKKFANPEGQDYDRFELKLAGKGASALVQEWVDNLLFANFEVIAATDEKTDRTRGVATGKRIAHTVRAGAYEAKNRHNLPDPMALDWASYREAVMEFFNPKAKEQQKSTTTRASTGRKRRKGRWASPAPGRNRLASSSTCSTARASRSVGTATSPTRPSSRR